MKVLVADKFEPSGVRGLEAAGCSVIVQPDLEGETLLKAVLAEKPEVLVVRSTRVGEAMFQGTSLALVVRAGAGYNTIDVAAASEAGVYVANCPGKNAHAVAELAFGLILALDRQIPDNVAELRAGRWNKKRFSKSRGLYGATLGLVGMGQIGQEMVPRARAFGMNVLASSRWLTPEVAAALGIGQARSHAELAAQADIVSVHVALRSDTKGMLGKEFFAAMRPGALFINTSRAEVIDEDALIEAVESGKIRAGLDVFASEPSGGEGEYIGPLRELAGVYCTHHIGASTEQAQEAVAQETVRIVREYKLTGIVPNVVNVSKSDIAKHLLVVRHRDVVGVLADVLVLLKNDGVNVQEMENIILRGSQAAIAQLSLDNPPSESSLASLRMLTDVFSCNLFEIAKAG